VSGTGRLRAAASMRTAVETAVGADAGTFVSFAVMVAPPVDL